MSVAHYNEEYDESMEENMAIEFGDEVATAVVAGTQLTPLLRQVLFLKAKEAAAERSNLIKAQNREAESLEKADKTFDEIQSGLAKYHPDELRGESYQTLVERWDELQSFENQCSNVLEDRQDRLNGEPLDRGGPSDSPRLVDYLYGSLEVDYPVLTTGISILDQIRTSRKTIVNVASNRR